MKRIILMVLYNILFVPYWMWQLCYYAKHTEEISEDKKWALLQKICKGALKGGRVTIEDHGTENIPKEGSFVFFPNHQGLFDVLAVIHSCPRFFSVVMKKEVKDIFFLKQIFAIMQAHAMDREDIRQSMEVINLVTKEVKAGKNFLIFPEGTRSKEGNKVQEFKGGSFKSAVRAKAPIVPMALIDSFVPFDRNTIKPVTVKIIYLEPMYYEEYKDMKAVEIAEEVRSRIVAAIEKYKD